MCIHTSGTHGYAFMYVLSRYEARGISRLVHYIEVYAIASFVGASQFSMELMLFRRGLSVIICNSEVYLISRVVLSRFDLYKQLSNFAAPTPDSDDVLVVASFLWEELRTIKRL